MILLEGRRDDSGSESRVKPVYKHRKTSPEAGRTMVRLLAGGVKQHLGPCQGKVEMSPSWQSRNVPFCLGLWKVHVNLRVPVKRRRALVATNPIKD